MLIRLVILIKDLIVGLCILAGLLMIGVCGYQLMFGTTLKPETNYREITTFKGKEIDSRDFRTDSAEVIHHRLVKYTIAGAGLLATGVAMIFLPGVAMKGILVALRAQRRTAAGEADAPLTEETAREFVGNIPALAEKHCEVASKVFGITLDYSAESIAELDRMVKEGWPNGPPTLLDEVVLGFGSYLGEAIRRVHGGEWCYSPTNGLYLDVGNKGLKIFPFAKARKRLVNGEEDSLAFYYAFIRSEAAKSEQPQ